MPLTLSLPITEDLSLYQGDDFDGFYIRLRDDTIGEDGITVISSVYRDLTGFTGKAQIRNMGGALLADMTVVVVDQTVARGGVLCMLSAAQTAVLPASPGPEDPIGRWDLQLTDTAGKIKTYVKGQVFVGSEVTT